MEQLPEKFTVEKLAWNDVKSLSVSDDEKKELRNYLLNKAPARSWLKKHPLYKNEYLPIDKVEYLLTMLFKSWRVEVKNVFQIANSIVVNIRLYYWNEDVNDYDWQDGTGAAPMQVNQGANPMDSNELKNNAVMLAVPIAKTNAVKDAADLIGRIFGRDLNRKDTLGYDNERNNERLNSILK